MEKDRAVLGLLVLVALVVGACSSGTTPAPTTGTPPGASAGTSQTVSGAVNFSSSAPLPGDAELVVTLVDNSDPDTATATIGETTVTAGGKTAPIQFSIPYDISVIDPSHLYAVNATILSGIQTLFVNKGQTLVITQGRPTNGVGVVMKAP